MSRSGEETRLPSKHPPASTAGNHSNQSEAPFRTRSTWDVADSETQTDNKDRRLFFVFCLVSMFQIAPLFLKSYSFLKNLLYKKHFTHRFYYNSCFN